MWQSFAAGVNTPNGGRHTDDGDSRLVEGANRNKGALATGVFAAQMD
jgi:hypothetical protein